MCGIMLHITFDIDSGPQLRHITQEYVSYA